MANTIVEFFESVKPQSDKLLKEIVWEQKLQFSRIETKIMKTNIGTK